jgi:hypothetical protein
MRVCPSFARRGLRVWLTVWLSMLAATLTGAAQRTLVVSELMYSPLADPAGVESTTDYEFIELANVSAAVVSLGGAYLTNAVEFVFPPDTTIPAGGFLVVPAKRSTFQARYGKAIPITSGFSGKLSDQGDTVELRAANGATLLRFTYDSSGGWPSRADGKGSSLELVDPQGDLNDPANWRSSTDYQGSPGRAGVGPLKQVVINEILAHTDPPLEDAIELLNLTAQPVAIGGWYLSNNRENPRKFRIPTGTVIPAGGFKVFYELAGTGSAAGFNPDATGDNPSFTFNSANGDEACLVSADAAGNLLDWMDAVTFGATANGQALGRYPDGTGRLTPMSRQTFGTVIDASFPGEFLLSFRTGLGASNAYPAVGPVVLSRIQYHPAEGGDEFIELQNVTTTSVTLYDPAYPTNTWRLRNAVDFDLPTGVTLAAGEKLLLVATNPAEFRLKHTIAPGIQIYGPWTNALNNAGETIELYQPDPPQLPPRPDAGFVPYVLVEEVSYLPSAPWPVAADGTGRALVRKGPALFGNDAANWEAEATTPVAPAVSVSVGGSGLVLGFVAEAGRSYRLQRRAALASGDWDAGAGVPVPVGGGSASVSVTPAAGGTEFYRLTVE